MKGYLDRIDDNKFAVILVEGLDKEFVIPKDVLPEGSTVKSYLDLTIENDEITGVTLNEQQTRNEQQKVDELMSKLRSINKRSKFQKK
jgi:ABC-type uncharacterized transport system ATPase subunit